LPLKTDIRSHVKRAALIIVVFCGENAPQRSFTRQAPRDGRYGFVTVTTVLTELAMKQFS